LTTRINKPFLEGLRVCEVTAAIVNVRTMYGTVSANLARTRLALGLPGALRVIQDLLAPSASFKILDDCGITKRLIDKKNNPNDAS
jgi:hypothetical protein